MLKFNRFCKQSERYTKREINSSSLGTDIHTFKLEAADNTLPEI